MSQSRAPRAATVEDSRRAGLSSTGRILLPPGAGPEGRARIRAHRGGRAVVCVQGGDSLLSFRQSLCSATRQGASGPALRGPARSHRGRGFPTGRPASQPPIEGEVSHDDSSPDRTVPVQERRPVQRVHARDGVHRAGGGGRLARARQGGGPRRSSASPMATRSWPSCPRTTRWTRGGCGASSAPAGLRLAREEEMAPLYPSCDKGAQPPFGPLYGQKVFVDRSLAADPEIVFHGGHARGCDPDEVRGFRGPREARARRVRPRAGAPPLTGARLRSGLRGKRGHQQGEGGDARGKRGDRGALLRCVDRRAGGDADRDAGDAALERAVVVRGAEQARAR